MYIKYSTTKLCKTKNLNYDSFWEKKSSSFSEHVIYVKADHHFRNVLFWNKEGLSERDVNLFVITVLLNAQSISLDLYKLYLFRQQHTLALKTFRQQVTFSFCFSSIFSTGTHILFRIPLSRQCR